MVEASKICEQKSTPVAQAMRWPHASTPVGVRGLGCKAYTERRKDDTHKSRSVPREREKG